MTDELMDLDGQITWQDRGFAFGKTYQEPLVQDNRKGQISKESSRSSSASQTRTLPMCLCLLGGGWSKSGCLYDEMGRWSIAWRVHDAQFWGVPQRRKRIALVADFGGLSAPEVLFERKGMSRDTEQSGAERQATARHPEDSLDSASYTLKVRGGVVK